MRTPRLSWLFAIFLSLLAHAAALAQALPQGLATAREPVRLTLIDAGNHRVGLQVRLAPGWKFYWRTPGEGGLPPRFDWSASRNLAAAKVAWPAPRRINIGGTELYGYTSEVVLPVTLKPQQAGAPVDIDLALEYGVCKEICVLREDRLTHRLIHSVGSVSDAQSAVADLLDRWQAKVPQPAERVGVRLLSKQAGPQELVVSLASDAPLLQPDLFVEGPSEAWFSRPQVTLSPDRRQARFAFDVAPAGAADKPLTLTLVDEAVLAELVLKR